MEAEPTPETRARTPLAAASMRLRGLLCRPFALRALVITGLAIAGWLLGAGGASAAVTPPADGNAVTGRLGGSVHAGAVHRAVGSPHRPAKPDDEPAVSGPVRQKIGAARGLVYAGRDAAGRATGRLKRAPVAGWAHDDRIGRPVRPVARLIDGTAPRPAEAPGTQRVHRVTTRVASLLGDGTNETGAPLPVGGAPGDPSPITGSTTRDVPSCAPTLAAAMRDGGVRACHRADASSYGTPAAYRTDGNLAAGSAARMPRPTLGRPNRPRTMCPRTATACGHGTRPQVPAVPAPTGPASGTYGVVPAPAPGPVPPGTGDLARAAYLDHPPRPAPTVATRHGVLPPVVRTAADEPALSPD